MNIRLISLCFLVCFLGPVQAQTEFIDIPEEAIYDETWRVEVHCNTSATNAYIRWTKKGDEDFVQPGANLTIAQVLPSDAGIYVCEVSSQDWQGSEEMNLIVQYMPRAPQFAVNQYAARVGDTVELICEVNAYPQVTFTWKFAQQELPYHTDTDYSSVLLLTNLQSSEFGRYTCVASNAIGENNIGIDLELPGVPDPPQYCTINNVTNIAVVLLCAAGFDGGGSVQYQVETTGTYVFPEFVRTDTEYMDDDKRAVLVTANDLSPNTSYVLKVFAENEFGMSDFSIAVQVQTLDIPVVIVVDSSSFPLAAVIGGAAGGVLLVLLIIICVCCLCRSTDTKTKSKKENAPVEDGSMMNSNSLGRSGIQSDIIRQPPFTDSESNTMSSVVSLEQQQVQNAPPGSIQGRGPSRLTSTGVNQELRASNFGKGRSSFGKGRFSFGKGRKSFGKGRNAQPRPNPYSGEYGGVSYEDFERNQGARPLRLEGFEPGETSDYVFQNRAYSGSQEYLESGFNTPSRSRKPTYEELANMYNNMQAMGSQQPGLAGMGAMSPLPILSPLTPHQGPHHAGIRQGRGGQGQPAPLPNLPHTQPSYQAPVPEQHRMHEPERTISPLDGAADLPAASQPKTKKKRPRKPQGEASPAEDQQEVLPRQPDAYVEHPVTPSNQHRIPVYPQDPFEMEGPPDYPPPKYEDHHPVLIPMTPQQPINSSAQSQTPPTQPHHIVPNSPPNHQGDTSYHLPDEFWEFAREKLHIRQKIGDGMYGEVWRARADGICGWPGQTVVAVKMLKDDYTEEEKRAILRELQIMKNLQPHPNIIALLGCCTKEEPPYIILEYASRGTMQTLLRSYRLPWTASPADKYSPYANTPPVRKLTLHDLTSFSSQISVGMEYLASKQLLHRDLAARNILVDEDYVCKISDFGFARDVARSRQYESKTRNRLPIRWMAPESLFDCIYTLKSDVWAFGILLWEIVTLGSSPYPGVSGSEVMDLVQQGFRMDKPRLCSEQLYQMMCECWRQDPRQRPSFSQIAKTLEDILEHEDPVIADIYVDQMTDNFYEILQNQPGEKC